LHRIDWAVPKFEIGYWVRTPLAGQGYVSEMVHALRAMAFETLNAERVEIRCDNANERSWRVAERCGFTLEGVLRRDSRAPDGSVRDTRVYARVRAAGN
jgi:RimJ/RimL family protein N-acetyltransferase